MAARRTDLQKKKIIADYAMLENYSQTARINGVSRNTVKRIIRSNGEFAEKVQQKKRENTQDILSYLDGKKTKVCSIIDKILDALDDDEKLRQSPPSQITTSLGILIDKFSAVSEKSDSNSQPDDALTKALKEEAERMKNADKP